jgi:hypothetical protein
MQLRMLLRARLRVCLRCGPVLLWLLCVACSCLAPGVVTQAQLLLQLLRQIPSLLLMLMATILSIIRAQLQCTVSMLQCQAIVNNAATTLLCAPHVL